ncbi:hypothetical protein GCM10010297_17420 [Streptomyces malachitofuscus]|nr:hypothetical protein GCM10010297_17420 [Streptomyces malachitofuscus]
MNFRRAIATAAVIAPLGLLSAATAKEMPDTRKSEGTSAEAAREPCIDKNGKSTARLTSDLESETSGPRFIIVAGSGWQEFTFHVRNRSDHGIENIQPLIGGGVRGWEDDNDYSHHLTVQAFDRTTGAWTTLTHPKGGVSTLTAFSLGPGQSVSHRFRLRVSGNVPEAVGHITGKARFADKHGCRQADDPGESISMFEVRPTGTEPGRIDTGSGAS